MLGSLTLVITLSLCASLAFALSSSLKHVSAGHVPDAQSLRPTEVRGFVHATLTHRYWLAGIGCDVVGLTLQIIALHLGALAIVQPVLVSGMVFAVLFRQLHAHHHVTRREIVWVAALAVALAGFLLVVGSGLPLRHERVDRVPAVIAGVIGAALAAVCVQYGRRSAGQGRAAALIGVAVGIIYAADAALLKALGDIAVRTWLDVLISWQLYALLALGAAGLLLNQLAFQAGPITASLPATATVDPLLSIVVGVVVYDEHIRRGPGAGAALALLLVVMGVGAFQFVRVAAPDVESS